MCNIQDYSVLYNNAVRLVTCEGWHNFTKRGYFGYIKLVLPRHFLLKCLHQARKVRGHVFVLGVSILHLSTILIFDLILLFLECIICCFSLYYHTL